ncbi:hypothetical protein Psi01_26420 [Planobispora siamensis]|uniref:Uncharacterized protein n=1 Tax=Planobispora siamensis TaxID=936338 RepID=A0A8J3WKW8_9ACTN|nr:hypothetical protein Psi01_26420 [Planobispora siamensis]
MPPASSIQMPTKSLPIIVKTQPIGSGWEVAGLRAGDFGRAPEARLAEAVRA